MRNYILLLSAAIVLGTAASARPVKDAPSWVTEVSSRKTAAYSGEVPAVCLLREKRVAVDSSGQRVVTMREATKILTRAGQGEASVTIGGSKGGTHVRSLKAWLVSPDGFVKTYDRNSVATIQAFDRMDLYSDLTYLQIKADNPEVGSTFVYETEIEEHPLFAQDTFAFQDELPAVDSRYVITVPAAWSVKGLVLNHDPVTPSVDGTTYEWRLGGLPYHRDEPDAPEVYGLVPQLRIDVKADGPAAPAQPSFASWSDVSHWHTGLSSGTDNVTPAIAAKAQELSPGGANFYASIQAIGRYVQSIRYVAIEMNLAKGGGYKPHPADLVLQKQYGDCKDKANLLRALLKSRGIESFLVSVYSGDRGHVRPEWPSPMQFNHMILAIRAPSDLPATVPTVQVPELGRVLIFDPTDDATPMGDLPWYEQGSYGCLMAGSKGTLIQLPVLPPSQTLTDVTVTGKLGTDGLLEAECTMLETGDDAASIRSRQFHTTPEQNRSHWERYLARGARNVSLTKLDTSDQWDQNRLHLQVALTAREYAQKMQDRLLVFGPTVLDPLSPSLPVDSHRTAPVILMGRTYRKHVVIELPQGFGPDEMPEDVKQQAAWGSFAIHYECQGGKLRMEEELIIEPQTLAPEKYKSVKQFFDSFNGADQQKAVLAKS